MNWKEQEELNYKFLDTIDFSPLLYKYDLVNSIMDIVRDKYYFDLPKELEGDPFAFLSVDEVAGYLAKRYNKHVEEEVRYYLW